MSIRTERVAALIRQETAIILERELHFRLPGMVTVTSVKVSDDLKNAKIYVSVFHQEGTKQEIIKKLNFEKKQIRFALSKKLYLKFMPEIFFYLDETFDEAEKLENLFRQIHKDEHN
jgi:ribosome-binding factor A